MSIFYIIKKMPFSIISPDFTAYASEISTVLLVTASLTLVGIALVFKITRRKKRLKAFAALNKLNYCYRDLQLSQQLACMPLEKNSQRHKMRNFLSGGILDNAVYFDSFSRAPITLDSFGQSVMYFHAGHNLPEFYVMPKEAPFRVPAAAGRVILCKEFEAGYMLYSSNPGKIKEFFSAGPERFFCTERGWSVEHRDSMTLVYRSGVLYSVFALADFMNKAFEVYLSGLRAHTPPRPPLPLEIHP